MVTVGDMVPLCDHVGSSYNSLPTKQRQRDKVNEVLTIGAPFIESSNKWYSSWHTRLVRLDIRAT